MLKTLGAFKPELRLARSRESARGSALRCPRPARDGCRVLKSPIAGIRVGGERAVVEADVVADAAFSRGVLGRMDRELLEPLPRSGDALGRDDDGWKRRR
jgi:hypothetical protein